MDIDVNGRLSIKLVDEEIDRIVIKHCQTSVKMCLDIVELERRKLRMKGEPASAYAIAVANIYDQKRCVDALNVVIDFFGGEQIYTDEDTFNTEVRDEATVGST